MRKKLLRILRYAPLALLFAAGVASAQTTGTIIGVVTDASTGKPVAGALVVATSPALQGEQTAVTDASGNFRITLLPAGEYKLAYQLQGYKPFERGDIRLRLDKTLKVDGVLTPEAVQMEEQVVRTGVAPVVNVGSAESATVVSKEFISQVPVGRDFAAIAQVVPNANTNDPYGVGFAGAQSPENQYIVDGANATDPAFGTRFGGSQASNVGGAPSLLSNFYDEIDVKTSGYSAEYGRATGGLISTGLKSGSNEYHGSVFGTLTPRSLIEPDGRTTGAAGEAIAFFTKPSAGAYYADFGFEIGGPVVKDKLWFYAGFAPVLSKTVYDRFHRTNVLAVADAGSPTGLSCSGTPYNPASDPSGYNRCVDADGVFIQQAIPGSDQEIETTRAAYQWLGKLTYLLDENNTFTVSGWGVPGRYDVLLGGFFGGTMYSSPSARTRDTDANVMLLSGKYGGKFLDKKLIVTAQADYYRATNTPKPATIDGIAQGSTPRMEWVEDRILTDFEAQPACTSLALCPVNSYGTGGTGFNGDVTTQRLAGKVSAAYNFQAGGYHTVKGGVDLERDQYDIDKDYTGGWYYLKVGSQLRAFRGYGKINDPSGYTDDPALVQPGPVNNSSYTTSFAYFLQDQYQPIPNLTLNLGLRLETQKMENNTVRDLGVANGFSINDNWSPRLGAIWDFTGQGRGKVAGSWGRFYYAMPLDMGDRAFGAETQIQWRALFASCPGGTAPLANGGAAAFDTTAPNFTTCTTLVHPGSWPANFRQIGATDPTPVDPNLKGAYVDQFGGQVEYEVMADLSVGVEYAGRRQGYVIEDMSSDDGGHYFIGNPGKDADIPNPDPTAPNPTVNSKRVQTFDVNTGRIISIDFPVPERSYDGFTLKVTKNFSRSWQMQASYTYSVLRGNYAGPYYPEYTQLDPGITAEYDLASLMGNKTGLLAGDQTHAIKLFGAYTWNVSPRFAVVASGAYTGTSGTPVSVLGAHPDYGSGSTNIIPKGQGGRTPFTHKVDLGAGVEYVITPPYRVKFRADLFNVFNSQEVLAYQQDYTFDTVTPISGLNCQARDYAGQQNPVEALQKDCPQVAYLKTIEGRPVTVNPSWGKPGRLTTDFLAPISLRLSLALTF